MSKYSDKIASQKTGMYRVADLQGPITEVTHTIDYLEEDQIGFDGKTIDILHFRDTQKTLSLNITNAETLIALFGDEPSKWSGHRVTLYVGFYGRNLDKPGIRLKAPDAPAGTKTAGASVNGPQPITENESGAIALPSRSADLDDEVPL
jgi:hypothetical protein